MGGVVLSYGDNNIDGNTNVKTAYLTMMEIARRHEEPRGFNVG